MAFDGVAAPTTFSRAWASWTSLIVLVAAFGCGDANDAAPGGSGSSVVSGPLVPGGFALAPSESTEARERFDASTGTLERLGLPLRVQIGIAWGMNAPDPLLQIELPEGRFDVRARPESGGREASEALIRGGLSQHLGIVAERGNWRGDVLELRLLASGLVPEPTEAKPAGAPEDVRRVGEYRVHGAPISDLVGFLARTSSTPIVDATGLDQSYDVAIEWDTSRGSRALRTALSDAGFELVRARGELQRWIVRRAP